MLATERSVSREGRTVNTEGWKALKVLAAEQETTLNALAAEAFNDLLKKHGKRQSVENPLLD
jgi:hypothetical protein